jgi:hypothetical protein
VIDEGYPISNTSLGEGWERPPTSAYQITCEFWGMGVKNSGLGRNKKRPLVSSDPTVEHPPCQTTPDEVSGTKTASCNVFGKPKTGVERLKTPPPVPKPTLELRSDFKPRMEALALGWDLDLGLRLEPITSHPLCAQRA